MDKGLAALASELKELKASVNISARRVSLPSSSPLLEPIPPTSKQFTAAAQQIAKSNLNATKSIAEQPNRASPTLSASSERRVSRIVQDLQSHYDEVTSVRREIAILKQVYVENMDQTKTLLSSIRGQAERIRHIGNTKISASRSYIEAGKARLDSRSQDLLTKIEELQDSIDDLRTDVVQKRALPKSQVMAENKAQVAATLAELNSLSEHIEAISPSWKQTWSTELKNIVDERDFLKHQDSLIKDLKTDHQALTTVFERIEQYIQVKGGNPSSYPSNSIARLRDGSRTMNSGHETLGTILFEVKALEPDSSKRLRAIANAEKARNKDLASRTDEFSSELGNFVDGKRLKKTGMNLHLSLLQAKSYSRRHFRWS